MEEFRYCLFSLPSTFFFFLVSVMIGSHIIECVFFLCIVCALHFILSLFLHVGDANAFEVCLY